MWPGADRLGSVEMERELNTSIDIADVLALTTVAGIAVYVVGLIGLAIAIRREFTRDISTAWYVVALLPRTVVAGQGVRIWLVWPVSLAMLLTALVALIAGHPNLALLIPGLGLAFATLLAFLVLRSTTRTAHLPMDNQWGVGHLVAITAVAGLVGSIMMSKGTHLIFLTAISAGNLVPDSPSRNLLVGAVLFTFGGFFVALPGAVVVSDPLPPVRIDMGSGVACLDGYLVTHADGFWYFFDEYKELQAIPDAKVFGVRTIEEAEIGRAKGDASTEAGLK
jgi:hypothetical protein